MYFILQELYSYACCYSRHGGLCIFTFTRIYLILLKLKNLKKKLLKKKVFNKETFLPYHFRVKIYRFSNCNLTTTIFHCTV